MPVVVANMPEAARERARRYNGAQISLNSDNGKAHTSLVGMAIGSAVTIRLVEMLVYTALADGVPAKAEPIIEDCLSRLRKTGDRLAKDGRTIEDAAETAVVLKDNVPEVLSIALPMWRRVGAI
jgi:hypothetical protein